MARILVIDDDDAVRSTVRRILEPLGHEVQEADDGAAGLTLLADKGADLVITDIFMPGQDVLDGSVVGCARGRTPLRFGWAPHPPAGRGPPRPRRASLRPRGGDALAGGGGGLPPVPDPHPSLPARCSRASPARSWRA